jgi:hypothetical protein
VIKKQAALMFYCNEHSSPGACVNDTSNACQWQELLGASACTADISLASISTFLVGAAACVRGA